MSCKFVIVILCVITALLDFYSSLLFTCFLHVQCNSQQGVSLHVENLILLFLMLKAL